MERTVNESCWLDDREEGGAVTTPGASWQRSWRLLPEGLEHVATGYFIEREVLGARRRDGLWDWPLQIAEKSWSDPTSFENAFRAALARFGIAGDDGLRRSFGAQKPVTRPGSIEGFRPLADVVATPSVRARARRSVSRRAGTPSVSTPVAARRLAEAGA